MDLRQMSHLPMSRLTIIWIALLVSLCGSGFVHSNVQEQSRALVGIIENGSIPNVGVEALPVILHQQSSQEYTERATTTDSNGRFEFLGIEIVPGFSYGVSVIYQGVLYGEDIDVNIIGNHPVRLSIYETTEDNDVLRVTATTVLVTSVERRHQLVEILEMVSFENSSTSTYVPGPEPMKLLRFSLPDGSQELQVRTDLLEGEVLQVDLGFALTSPIPPGVHDLLFSYRFPYQGSEISFTKSFPHGADQFRVLTEKDGIRVRSSDLASGEPVIVGSNIYELLITEDLSNGSGIAITLNDLPTATIWDRTMVHAQGIDWLFVPSAGLAVIGGGTILFVAIREKRRRTERQRMIQASDVISTRQETLRFLLELETSFENGEVDSTLYQLERRRFLGQLASMPRREDDSELHG